MSMHDALAKLRGKVPWLTERPPEPPVSPIETVSAVDEIAELVRQARATNVVDAQSGTWLAVSAWAARRTIEIMASTKDDGRAAKLAVLRELLTLHSPAQEPARFEDQAPYIP